MELEVVVDVVVLVDPGTSPGAAVNRSSCVWTDWTIGTGSEPSHEPRSVEYTLRKSTDTRMLSLPSRSVSVGVAPCTPPRTLSPTTNDDEDDPWSVPPDVFSSTRRPNSEYVNIVTRFERVGSTRA